MSGSGLKAVTLAVVLAAAAAGPAPAADKGNPAGVPEMGRLLGGGDTRGFARADHPRQFHFPADHGPHPAYRSEWWYFTGNLQTAGGRRFGYELTVFRFALAPPPAQGTAPRPSHWATRQVYMAHLALTDVQGRRFQAYQRLARGALGLAGARASPFRVWVGDWFVGGPDGGPWHLHARHGAIKLDLTLTPAAPIVLQGDHGLSRKSGAPGNASYYYSIPRLTTAGTVTVDHRDWKVTGSSWLDREWSTSALGSDQAGWDWFALQLEDGSDLMFYRLRRKDGSVDPHSAGSLLEPDGKVVRLNRSDVKVTVRSHWRSPRGGTYPSRWHLSVPKLHLDLDVTPLLADQELDLSVRYWEGAVKVTGSRRDKAVQGVGYVELTGY